MRESQASDRVLWLSLRIMYLEEPCILRRKCVRSMIEDFSDDFSEQAEPVS